MGLRDWLLGETYRVDCGDGRKMEVYRDIDKIFPLYAKEGGVSVSGAVNLAEQLDANVDVKTRNNISQAFVSIHEMNASAMMDMRAAYISYKNNPCGNEEFYNREVVVVRETRSRLEALKIKLSSVIFTLQNGGDAAVAQESLNEVLGDLRLKDVAASAAAQITRAQAIASSMGDRG